MDSRPPSLRGQVIGGRQCGRKEKIKRCGLLGFIVRDIIDNMRMYLSNILYPDQRRNIIITALVLFLGLPVTSLFDDFWLHYFCMPSAQLCSLFLGSDCITTSEGYLLTNDLLAIHVTKVCSGASFFILLCALMIGLTVQSIGLKNLIRLSWILPLAYVVTILANSSRILGGWITGRWARAFLPEPWWGGIHLGTGVVIFLTFLIAIYSILTWKTYHGLERIKTFDC